MSEHRRLLKSASTISAITLISRIFGYLRDSRIAFFLGTGSAADAFTIAFRIPNLIRRLVGEGAVSAAFIPVFTRYLFDDNKKEAWEFANALLSISVLLLTSVTILGILFSPLLIELFAYGFLKTPGKFDEAILLNRIMFPYIAMVSMFAIATGVLNSFHRFAAPAFGPVVLNLSIITLSFLTRWFPNPAIALAVGVVVGGFFQVLIQIPPLRRSGWHFRLVWNLAHTGVKKVGTLLVPLFFGVGIAQINVLVGTQFASRMGEGSVASIYLADRVMELVLGAYAVALATAILPVFSRQAAALQTGEMRVTLNLAARLILFITVPATVGLILLRRPIIQVLFEHGTFSAASTELTIRPLLFFALGLSTISMAKIIVPAFYAVHDTKTPVKVAFVSMLLNGVFNVLFMRPLQNGGPALAVSLASVSEFTLLMLIFQSRYGSIGITDVFRSLLKFLIAASAMAVAIRLLLGIEGLYAGELVHRALALAAMIAVAIMVYFVSTYGMRTRELREMWEIYGRRNG